MKSVSVIDNNGYCVSRTELIDDNNNLITYKLKEGESIVEKIKNVSFLKPKWKENHWVEGATVDEINSEDNKEIIEPNNKLIIGTLLKENAEIKMQLLELTSQIAELKGSVN